MNENTRKNHLSSPLSMRPEDFRAAGYLLVNKIAQFLEELPDKPVTTAAQPPEIKAILGNAPLPLYGEPVHHLIEEATHLLFRYSLLNGHPRFWGYITSSASPISALADMLAAAVNPNVGAFVLSPMATEIEKQTVKWLAELIHYPADCGGIFVSGGNMANFHGFLAARHAKMKGNIREKGIGGFLKEPAAWVWGKPNGLSQARQFTVYCAKGTHTWIQKAADLFGHGTDSIRWIDVNENHQMNIGDLQNLLELDLAQGHIPFLVVGNAGSVSTGAVDDLTAISNIAKHYNLWFHIDGAYGAPAAALPENAALFAGLEAADSIALDPHKWLYSALEAGCILVKNPQHLLETFSFQPDYYNFNGDGKAAPTNYHEYGMQNSRGFRALKVWLELKQAGKLGYIDMIRDDISLAKNLFELVESHPELEAVSQNLSITTFRYIPQELPENEAEAYINEVNEALLNRLQAGGDVFLSNAIINGKYCLRVCIVNFRTTLNDIIALVNIVVREGKFAESTLQATVV